MKRMRFLDPAGSRRTGIWRDGEIEAAGRQYAVGDVTVLPPVDPPKVLGVGRNYRGLFDSPSEFPDPPRLWWKGGSNVVSGHGSTVTIPDSGEVVFEGELGVVIDEQCRNVSRENALDFVAGYTCVNDLSDVSHAGESSMLRTKSFDNAAPMGPVLASPDEVPETPRIRLWVNGEKRQDSSGDEYIYSVPEMIENVTRRLTLERGDVIMMGNPGEFEPLHDGDDVEIEIEGIGRLQHSVEVEQR